MTKANIPLIPQFIDPTSIQSADYSRAVFRLTLDEVFSKEDLLVSKNWRQIAKSNPVMKHGDKIEVLRRDSAFYAELLVVGKVNDELFLKTLLFVELEEVKHTDASDFEIVWKGPVRKFAVIRKSDNSLRKDGLASREEALFHIKNTL